MRPESLGQLKCFCAPIHQILAKSAPQKARNRDKAKFAAKLRKLSKNCVNVLIPGLKILVPAGAWPS